MSHSTNIISDYRNSVYKLKIHFDVHVSDSFQTSIWHPETLNKKRKFSRYDCQFYGCDLVTFIYRYEVD